MPFFPEAAPAPAVQQAPDFEGFVAAYRAQVTALPRHLYLNHASVGPLSEWVIAAVVEQLRQQAMAETLVQDGWFDSWRLARQRIAELIGASRDEICTTESTSSGMHRVVDALPLGPGDEAVIPADDFPSVYYAMSLLRAQGVKVVEAQSSGGDGIVRTDDVLNAITPRTKLLTVSWVNFMHGYTMDLARLSAACRERGIWFMLDSIQGLGPLELNIRDYGIHFVAGQGSKWLCAPLASGFLYVSDDVDKSIYPRHLGWLSMDLDHSDYTNRDIRPRSNANRFSLGTYTFPSQMGMRRACEILLEAGRSRVEARALENAESIVRAAEAAGMNVYSDRSAPSAIVSLELGGFEELPGRLTSANVAFSVRSGRLRLSPHWYNTAEEMARVAELLDPS